MPAGESLRPSETGEKEEQVRRVSKKRWLLAAAAVAALATAALAYGQGLSEEKIR
jgi:hypothetical protein